MMLLFLVLLVKWEGEPGSKTVHERASKPTNVCLAGDLLGDPTHGCFHTEEIEFLVTIQCLGLDASEYWSGTDWRIPRDPLISSQP